jgi:hypothetical protein
LIGGGKMRGEINGGFGSAIGAIPGHLDLP